MSDAEAVGMSAERLARIRPVLASYIDDGRLAGVTTLLARRGQIIHEETVGYRVRETSAPMMPDTIFRIFSMTKPIICTALMLLFEEGRFRLYDPVSRYIPAFADLKVYAGEDENGLRLEPLAREVTIRDLLTHTSGLTYHWLEYGPVEALYRREKVASDKPLAEFVADLLKLPLAFQPGTRWRYSYAHDVVAYLVEVISGQTAAEFLQARLFGPLGMVDTGYFVPADKLDRFAAMYGSRNVISPEMTVTEWFGAAIMGANNLLAGPEDGIEASPHEIHRGGHGLVSTAMDYYRFSQMLLDGGLANGQRIMSRKTIELMASNHLAPELLPYELAGLPSPGGGYGLGFRVLTDVAQTQLPGSVGSFSWGGAANTTFWIDPKEQLIGILMAQFQPSGHHPVADDFRQLVYAAIND
ncbi:MAG: beta-lactamase family protein [Anaerolineales bacterium]|nr:beta-lactamase family protein [Anaerolineales bacterium]